MRPFEYLAPTAADDAMSAGALPSSRFIAGGTLLVDLLRLEVERPRLVIDLNRCLSSELQWTTDTLSIGALAKNSDITDDGDVRREFRLLEQALLSGASPQIRNMASVGGNLLQRPRCPYFRDIGVSQCNKRNPGSGCAALGGYSRMHAILGASEHCIAVHPSDMAVALLALEARVRVRGPGGERQLSIDELLHVPGDTPEVEHALSPGELITHILVPRQHAAAPSAYVKVRDRAAFAFALASAAVVLRLNGSKIERARVALGGVGTKPWRARDVETALEGREATRASFAAAAKFAARGAKTTAHNAFKVRLIERVVARALLLATGTSGPAAATAAGRGAP